MAKYLSNIDLNKNQLQNAAVHPLAAAPSTPVEGQIYFDTTGGDKTLYFYNGSSWVSTGKQGDVTEVQSATTNQLTVSSGTGPVPSLSIVTGAVTNGGTALATGDQIHTFVTSQGYVQSVETGNSTYINLVDSGTSTAPDITASLSATGTADSTTFLRGDNTWAVPGGGGTVQTVGIAADNGSGTGITSTGTFTFTGGTNVTTSVTANEVTINSTDQFTGTVTSVGTGNSTFISGSGGAITGSGSLTYSLSASGTASSSTYLRGDNTWAALPADADNYVDSVTFNTGNGNLTIGRTGGLADITESLDGRYITGNENITLSGDITGSGTTSIATTISAGAVDFAMLNSAAVVTQAEGIQNNDNDTTIPTSAAVKDYVDSNVVGNLVYQGAYNASTNSPDLDSSPSSAIQRGWTYTVTADGLFFTEQVRIGDVLIAEVNSPTSLADWTTVQNNIDLASTSVAGIASFSSDNFAVNSGVVTIKDNGVILGTETTGNYIATIAEGAGIDVAGSGSESAAATVTLNLNELTVSTTPTHVSGNDGSGNTRKFTIATIADEVNKVNSFSGLIGANASETITSATHGLGTDSSLFLVQLVEVSSGETVGADVTRGASGAVTIDFASAPGANAIRVLIYNL